MIEIRWHGRGGQGGFTASRLLGIAAGMFEGKHALAFPSFGPERRGAPVLAFTKIDNHKINDRSEVEACDYVVIMDETLVNEDISKGIKNGATILINSSSEQKFEALKDFNVLTIDATSIALKILGKPITNTAMYGALVAASDLVSLDAATNSIKTEMKPTLIDKNIQIVEEAYKTIKSSK